MMQNNGKTPLQVTGTAISVENMGFYYPRHQGVVRYSREKLWVLEDVSFEISLGETVGIIGRNGAGKSTLMRLLAGIVTPDRGGVNIKDGLSVALLSLQAGFDPHLTGRDNVLIGAMLMGMRRAVALAKLPEIIELADLADCIDEPLRTYSTGMRARLGFATAYYTDTDVMLLDEVLSVGDARFSEITGKLMEERLKSNQTVVMVSHSEHKLKNLCSRLIWVDGGQIRADGSFDEVWQQYRSTYRKGLGLEV